MDSIGGDLTFMTPQPFEGDQLDAIRAISVERSYAPGDLLLAAEEPFDRFILVESGRIEVVDPDTGGRLLEATLGPGQFVGELNFLSGSPMSLAMRACEPTRTLEAPRLAMLDLMSRVPEIGDHILTVFAARRRTIFEEGRSSIRLVGMDQDPAVGRIASFLDRNRIAFRSRDPETGEQPGVLIGDGRLDDPSPRTLARRLGLDIDSADRDQLDLIIVGAGPAGVAAAVYAGAEGLRALVVEDTAIGGQAGTSSRIENYLGFPTGISGADLIFRGEVQAMKFGTRFAMPRRVDKLAQTDDGFCITLDDGDQLCAKAVLVATGVQYQRLPVDRLEAFEGAGVYYAATEMEARFCRETEAVVIGGGNSAGQAAMYLSRTARHVHLLVRRSGLADTMSAYLRQRLEADPRITIHYRTELAGLEGEQRLSAVRIAGPGGERRLESSALFVMIGAAPNTAWLSGLVALDPKGFVLTGQEVGGRSTFESSHPGIFAVGDVRAGSVKRVASSVGEGSVVISAVWSHVNAPPAPTTGIGG
ncbi:cyclic nucleotide-binding domain-containing thioredoxin-disulfide reductase [Sphingomonas sp. LHG3406-1]|uniref:FAD-dependent oxidoreductase n=1 Tax=Sphingomonas sp. LHG3406-1 TaxID=2804617 RepID=UPI00262461F5|nr:cyclic nucleotide-binding domain-containing thioredoxin-disulfide reductase [Sphingomonas sp. LHG3406-1]